MLNLQCFDAVRLVSGKTSDLPIPVKIDAGMVICLDCGENDLHMVQMMSLPPRHLLFCYKGSAVAELGNHFATADMGRKGGLLCPFGGELDRHLTQCGLRRDLPPYQVAC